MGNCFLPTILSGTKCITGSNNDMNNNDNEENDDKVIKQIESNSDKIKSITLKPIPTKVWSNFKSLLFC